MKIEILDGASNMITIVDGVVDPDREVAEYGGTTWADYVEPDAARIDRLRVAKITATKNHAVTLIGKIIPALADIKLLDLIITLKQSGAFLATFPTARSDMDKVSDVYLYAKQKIVQLRVADEATILAYDPGSDNGWPA